jgi:ribosomal protein S18 acetylase RimI-like enzyme
VVSRNNADFASGHTMQTENGPVSIGYEGQSELNTHTPERLGWHSVVARNEDKDVVGVMHWRKKASGGANAGQVDWVEVDPSFQRMGIGRQMWEHAQAVGVSPSPKHSAERTDKGESWAKSVGGRVPRRKEKA